MLNASHVDSEIFIATKNNISHYKLFLWHMKLMSYREPCADQLEEQCTTPRPLKCRKVAASPLLQSITACRLLLLKCSDVEGQQQQETSSTDYTVKLVQAAPSSVMDSIEEICESVHNHYPELHFQDSSKDEWLGLFFFQVACRLHDVRTFNGLFMMSHPRRHKSYIQYQ